MPVLDNRPLDNERHEKYCQGRAQDLNRKQAYINAGFSANGADQAASRLDKDIRIQRRIIEIKQAIVERLNIATSPHALQAQSFIRQQVQERQYRLSILQDIVDRLRCVIDARAVEYKDKCAGGGTGLLVKQVKGVGGGANFREVEEYVVDRGTIAELREQLKQAAIESGDWDEEQFKPPARVDESAEGKSVEQLYLEQAVLLEAKAKLDAIRCQKPQPQLTIEASGVEVVRDSEGVGHGAEVAPVAEDAAS